MLNRPRSNALALTAIVGLALAAGSTHAQQARRDAPEARRERPVLSGPQVRERRMPGIESGFSQGAQEGRRAANAFVPPQIFRRVLGELMAEDAPLEIRLSAEQRERIANHVRAFEREAGGGERAGNRRQGRPGINDGQPPRRRRLDGDAMTDRPQRPARPMAGEGGDERPQRPAREGRGQRGAPIDGNRPGIERREGAGRTGEAARARNVRAVAQLQHRVWAELSAAQQHHVHEAIEAWRADQSEQQMDRMRERYRREIGNRFDEMGERPARDVDRRGAAGGQDSGASELRRWLSELPEDMQRRVRQRLELVPQERRAALAERFAGMSPEARQQLLERLLGDARQDSSVRPPR
ncbi:MAG: hypothetical protein RIE32_02045 [Phycisphaerales bacterium]